MTTDIEKFFYAEYKKYIKRNPGISIYWNQHISRRKNLILSWDYYHPHPIVYRDGKNPDRHLAAFRSEYNIKTIPTPFLEEFLYLNPKDPFSWSKKPLVSDEEIPIIFKSVVEQIILEFFDKKNIDCLILPLETTEYSCTLGGECKPFTTNIATGCSPWRFVAAGEAAKEDTKTIKPTSFAKVVGINTETDKIKILSKSKEMWNLAKAFEDFICFCQGRDYYFEEDWPTYAEPEDTEFFYYWAIIYRDKSNKINFIEQEMMATDNSNKEPRDYPTDGNFGRGGGFPFLPDTHSGIQEKFPALFNLLMKFKVLFPSVA